MSPSTQRAVIMTTVFLMALVAGRRHQLINSLALAALVILAVHPPSLFAVSFQLSFAAVFFIILGMNAVEGLLDRLENRWFKRGAAFILVSFFAIAGTSPLTAHYFNQVSWIGLFTNCFMIPLVGFAALPLGLAGAALNGLFPDLSMILFKTGGDILSLAFNIIEKIAALPHVSVKTVTPGLIETGCCYALLVAGIMVVKHNRFFFPEGSGPRPPAMPVALKIALPLAAMAVIILIVDAGYWINRRFLHDDLRVTALDVGQGNAALVEFPGGKCMLIDGGGFTGSSTFDVGKMIVAPFLWRNKIGTVDTVILTHPDTDHLGGLVYIAEHFHVKTVWSTGEAVETEHFQRFMRVAQKNQINMIKNTRPAQDRVINGVRIETLYPPRDFLDQKKVQPWRNTNNNSLVTRFVLGDISFLFPGDIEAEGERELAVLSEKKLASTVLMAPHHGSRTSNTAFFLSLVKPDVVVVSAGRYNRFGYPCPDVLDRYAALGADVFRTGLDGAVVMSTNGKSLRVTTPMAEE
jgi:competence protein ComEC